MESFKLGPEDAAVIFRGDGKSELMMPEAQDPMEVALPAACAAARVAVFLGSPHIIDLVDAELEKMGTALN